MRQIQLILISCAGLLKLKYTDAQYTTEAIADKVDALPRATKVLSNQFSGYLDVTPTKMLHYMYFESENSPSADSIVFWTNGGPGCSGLLGLFTGMTEYHISLLD
jgi:carboxypeptidase C (cathepsin A)